ncbi:hypothetical protein ACRRTK_020161 [Alexandromys fortis]
MTQDLRAWKKEELLKQPDQWKREQYQLRVTKVTNRWRYVQALQNSSHLQIHCQCPHCLNQTQESLRKYYKGSK